MDTGSLYKVIFFYFIKYMDPYMMYGLKSSCTSLENFSESIILMSVV